MANKRKSSENGGLRIVNTALLHTKKRRLMSIVTEHFYQKEKNNELPVAILSHAVECHGAEDGAHMTHVGLATGLLLQRMMEKTDRYHLEQADIEAIRMASELHDIGKLQIPAEILTKPGALTAEECEIVKRHTVLGAKTITELPICQNERLADERPAQRMTPVMAEDDGMLRITRAQVDGVLRGYRQMFDITCLVDPGICMELTKSRGVNRSEHCYAVWNKTHRCERCISQEVVRSQTTQTKIETRGNDVFYVGASYLEVDGLPHSHELFDHLHSDDELVRYGGAYVKGRISQTIHKADLAMYEAKT